VFALNSGKAEAVNMSECIFCQTAAGHYRHRAVISHHE
jgi:hypothetical protein